MNQLALFGGVEPCPQCHAPMQETPREDWPGGFNYNLVCQTHGRQFTVSTRTNMTKTARRARLTED